MLNYVKLPEGKSLETKGGLVPGIFFPTRDVGEEIQFICMICSTHRWENS
jgi:hypothetical protein